MQKDAEEGKGWGRMLDDRKIRGGIKDVEKVIRFSCRGAASLENPRASLCKLCALKYR